MAGLMTPQPGVAPGEEASALPRTLRESLLRSSVNLGVALLHAGRVPEGSSLLEQAAAGAREWPGLEDPLGLAALEASRDAIGRDVDTSARVLAVLNSKPRSLAMRPDRAMLLTDGAYIMNTKRPVPPGGKSAGSKGKKKKAAGKKQGSCTAPSSANGGTGARATPRDSSSPRGRLGGKQRMAAFAARSGPAEGDPLGDSGLHWFGDEADEGGMGGASAHSRAGAGTVTQQPHVFDPSTTSEWEASPAGAGDVSGSMGDWAQPALHASDAEGGGGGHAGGHGGGAPMDWYDPDDMENEPPLLQELGIDMSHIKQKLVAIVDPRSRVNMEAVQDGDLFGPLLICLALGTTLLLRGQVHFGSIYGFGLVGCLGMYLVLNLMSTGRGIDAASVFSVFGYGLLPITVLAALSVVLPLSGALGLVVAPLCVAWSSWCATRFYEAALAMPEQRALIAYPTILLYAVFALLAVF